MHFDLRASRVLSNPGRFTTGSRVPQQRPEMPNAGKPLFHEKASGSSALGTKVFAGKANKVTKRFQSSPMLGVCRPCEGFLWIQSEVPSIHEGLNNQGLSVQVSRKVGKQLEIVNETPRDARRSILADITIKSQIETKHSQT